ncbi:MAG: hypothetical protein WBV60_01890 [Terriglobales bacterium]
MLAIALALGCSRQTSQTLVDSLAQLQQQKRVAIGYIYDRKLNLLQLEKAPHIRDYTIPGPGFYAASLGPSGSFYGVNRQDENEFLVLRQNGEISWRRRGLYAEEDPTVSPEGTKVVFKGRDRETQQSGLLLVEDEGKTVSLIARDGSGPSWSPDGSRLCYQNSSEILVFDLRTRRSNGIAQGTNATWSPDGDLISFRTNENRFSLMDSRGKLKRALFDGKDILTPLSWSPDSQYLMYVKAGSSLHGVACSDASIDIMVVRVSDGLTSSLLETCNTVSPRVFRWLQIPSNLPL